jgi:ABC-2 type transport system ATP-binding protein
MPDNAAGADEDVPGHQEDSAYDNQASIEGRQPTLHDYIVTERHAQAGNSLAVEVRGLVKAYAGRAVVDGLSFSVASGEVFALLGPNGAGKTTTVEILEGYRKPDAGTVRVLGLDPIRDRAALKPCIGLMLQQGGLFPQITPREALRLFAAFYPRPEDPEALLNLLQLRDAASTRFRHLSGGQKQRLGLGLALIGRPQLVFLDEPTAAMDPQARRGTWNIIRELSERGTTVLLTTHLMEEAEQLANRVAIVDRGRLVALDTPARLRRAVTRELRFASEPPVEESEIAAALAVAIESISRENDGTMVLAIEPSPALVAELARWLASRGALLTELRAGSRSLEQAFLAITEPPSPPGSGPG